MGGVPPMDSMNMPPMDDSMPMGGMQPDMGEDTIPDTGNDNIPDMDMNNGGMGGNDETSEIISQLSDEDKEAVEAYAKSLLKKNEPKEKENDSMMGNSEMMPETFIFTKKQINEIKKRK